MSEPIELYSKEGFTFSKNGKNNYSLTFQMQNKSIILSNVIDFSLIELIYKLNNDIYEKINLYKINDNQAIMTILMKHLFEELGLPQRFSYVHMIKCFEPTKITFTSESIYSERPEGMPPAAEQMLIKNMICSCDIITPHNIIFVCNIIFEDRMIVPQFAEKMVGLILFKIFSRVKQFIENVSI
jgi:hypothetical protein